MVLGYIDVRDHTWRNLTPAQQDEVMEALRKQGVNPHDTYRIELLPFDGGAVRVWQYKTSDSGQLYVDDTGEVATSPPFHVQWTRLDLFKAAA